MSKIIIEIPRNSLRDVEITVNEKLHDLCGSKCQYLEGGWKSRFFCGLQKWFLITGAAYIQDKKDKFQDYESPYFDLYSDTDVNSVAVAARCQPCLDIGNPKEGNVIKVRLMKVPND